MVHKLELTIINTFRILIVVEQQLQLKFNYMVCAIEE